MDPKESAGQRSASSSISFIRYQKNMADLYIRVKYQSIFQIGFGGIFWIWAIINCIRFQTFDLGDLSFLTAMIAGALGQVSIRQVNLSNYTDHTGKGLPYAKYHFICTIAAHFFVAVNYLLGSIYGPTEGYQVYCVSFSMIWVLTGLLFGNWSLQWMRGLEPNRYALLQDDQLQAHDEPNVAPV